MDPSPSFACAVCGKEFASNRMLGGHRAGKHRLHQGFRRTTIHARDLSAARLGYIAGFLDGEGGIQITKSERKGREYKVALHPSVYFTNTDRAAIDSIRTWLGGGSLTRRTETGKHRDCYVLTVSGVKSILELLAAIRPYLIIKASRADVMMEFCQSRVSHYQGNHRRYTRNELRLYRALKRLNKRGGAQTSQRTDR